MLRYRCQSSSNLSDGRSLDNRVRCISNHQQKEIQKSSDKHFRGPAMLPKSEHVRGNRNPPLLMVKPIKRYEDDSLRDFPNDIKV